MLLDAEVGPRPEARQTAGPRSSSGRTRGRSPARGPKSVPSVGAALELKLGRRDPLTKTVFAQIAGDPVVLALPISFLDGWTFGAPGVPRPPGRRRSARPRPGADHDHPRPERGRDRVARRTATRRTGGCQAAGRRSGRSRDGRPRPVLALEPPGRDARHRPRRVRREVRADKPALPSQWKTHDEHAPPPRRTIEGEETTLSVGSVVPEQARPAAVCPGLVEPDRLHAAAPTSSPASRPSGATGQVFAIDPKATDRSPCAGRR